MMMSRAAGRTDAGLSPSGAAPNAGPIAAGRTPGVGGYFRHPLLPILTVVGVMVLVVLSVSFARFTRVVVGLWGASGAAMALWLRGGRGLAHDAGFAVLIAVGMLAGEFMGGGRPAVAVLLTLADLLEIMVAVALMRRLSPGFRVDSVEGLLRFLAVCAVAPMPAAMLGAIGLHTIIGSDWVEALGFWWVSQALGFAVVGVFGLSLERRRLEMLRRPARLVEGVVLTGLIVGACYGVFSHLSLPYGFMLLPPLVLMAMRFRVVGMAWSLLIVSVMAIGGAMAGSGPYHAFGPSERVLLSQLLVLLGYMPLLLVAALLEERDRLAEHAREGRIRAERASAAKSRLLANVAHEIKSPIGGVIGIGELWAGGHLGKTTPQQVEMAQMLVKTARQVEALAHDLLDVARTEGGDVRIDLRPTEVVGVLEDVRRSLLLNPAAAAMKIVIEAQDDQLVALADSHRLAQVLANLAGNAVKYAASGGQVTMRASWSAGRIRIEVIDRGPGLSAEKQAQLFEPFNRLGLERSAVEGHGVGLALAKRLTELQGGEIGVVSAPGHGATFWVELPVG